MKPNPSHRIFFTIALVFAAGIFVNSYGQAPVDRDTNRDSVQQISPPQFLANKRQFTPAKPDWKLENAKTLFPSKRAQTGDGWHFALAPHLYATGISGTISARGRTIDLNASFGDVWKKLDVPLMVSFEARKKRLFSLTDMIWVKLSDQRDTPGDIYSSRKIGINLLMLDPEVGYRLIDREKGSFDVLGGARIWTVEANINVTSGRLPGFEASQRKTWAAPVVGVRGSYDFTPKFFGSTRFDIGGAGIGADLTAQFYGGVGYRIVPKIALVGGYRFMHVDYDDHSGFLFNTRMNGIILGAKFSF